MALHHPTFDKPPRSRERARCCSREARGDASPRPGLPAGAAGVAGLLFVPVAATLAHLAYSSLGFNPTDEGFVLAQSRRLLDGQVPHRDFVSIRPVLSAVLHLPEVAWGGEYTYYLSRLVVWLQMATVAWLWTGLVGRAFGRWATVGPRLVLASVAFALTSSTYPLITWHTTDGAFLATIGLALLVGAPARRRLLGYFVLGLAALAKQNFLLVGPAAVILLGDRQAWRAWAAVALPGALYVAGLLALGAGRDAATQLTAETGLLGPGVLAYVGHWLFWSGAVVGALAARLASPASAGDPGASGDTRRTGAALVLLDGLVLLGSAIALRASDGTVLDFGSFRHFAFALFGAAAAVTLHAAWRDGLRAPRVRAGALALLTAWSASISSGLNTPMLGAGALGLVLLASARDAGPAPPGQLRWRPGTLSLAALTPLLLLGWGVARLEHIYGDAHASRLTERLDGVLPGARLIRTNPNTHAFLGDLRQAVARAGRVRSAIIVDGAAYWVQGPGRNPLSLDWPVLSEVGHPAILERLRGDLARGRGDLVVLVQKVWVMPLAYGFVPRAPESHPLILYVTRTFTRADETRFFTLYR